MKPIISILFLSFLASCFNRYDFKKGLDETDKIKIFRKLPEMDDGVDKVLLETTDKKEITKIIGFISDKRTTIHKCGFDSYIVFYKNEQHIRIADMNLHDDCGFIVFSHSDLIKSYKLTDEGLNFLRKLK